ncbi:dual specificity protein phosphatase family protein [Mucilaginibacter sp. ZT4R22]|uniref:Dual specificity protein phosphatase family protein n=2 Tax=Mucilaginibacter pankratovii TaxID=2772110 RepID=A0ABR7WIR5_9SPHI|nr:dual specificity protein phosphatase family protein [Mucilaginibacter pankratovii]
MFSKIKSSALVVYIFLQKMADITHRYVYGIPNIKRSQITAHLFLGSQYNLIGLKKLKALGVTAIVNMRIHSVYTEAQYGGFKYLHLPTVDNTPPDLDTLLKGATFMETEIKAGGIVYVHCRQGLGRGPTMAIAYLIKAGATYQDAFDLVKSVRTFINPRPGQIQRLKELEKVCREMDKGSAS